MTVSTILPENARRAKRYRSPPPALLHARLTARLHEVELDLHAWSAIHLQRRNKRLLRDIHLAELAHLLLAFLLLLQKFALSRDVAAVAFRGDVLAQRADGFAGDDLAADRRLIVECRRRCRRPDI